MIIRKFNTINCYYFSRELNETHDNYNNMEDFQVDDSWEQSYETKTDTLSANNESAEFDDYEVDGDLYKSKEFIPEPTREVSNAKKNVLSEK